MKNMILRCLVGLLAIFFLLIGYFHYTEPVGNEGRILGMVGMASSFIAALNYAITGSHLFPRFSLKKKDK